MTPIPHVANASDLSRADDVQALFNRIAPMYDQLNHWLSLGQHSTWKQMAIKWSAPFPGATCLDVCCGSGDLTRLLAKAVGPTGHVTGLDFAAAQLERAKHITYRKLGYPPIDWIEGDALDLPFTGNHFDCITMGYGLRNVANIQTALQELLRVLKPGCTVAILDFHRPQQPEMLQFQQWCLKQVVVPLAEQFGLREEYAYIWPSLAQFPQGPEQVEQARRVGFVNVTHYPIVGGMMGILVAQKPID
ncbi:MAG: bifunctional demethylmenaquinone methyltransferase/2-methoxy-6-polyprenyl-1,4-benzoquinol methylase UbiE [Merismopedia sp. SIO2A8]|nr:bifunctional demethylmenaquinone methyltransferase/2-methoxy-6-polyprenyl-1,4-benzoquinol methylase UbiE [Merismopedia sp. SIO2A8]